MPILKRRRRITFIKYAHGRKWYLTKYVHRFRSMVTRYTIFKCMHCVHPSMVITLLFPEVTAVSLSGVLENEDEGDGEGDKCGVHTPKTLPLSLTVHWTDHNKNRRKRERRFKFDHKSKNRTNYARAKGKSLTIISFRAQLGKLYIRLGKSLTMWRIAKLIFIIEPADFGEVKTYRNCTHTHLYTCPCIDEFSIRTPLIAYLHTYARARFRIIIKMEVW